LYKVANTETNRQTNNDDYMYSLTEVIIKDYQLTQVHLKMAIKTGWLTV